MKSPRDCLFLIGGHDLEMLEIIQILERNELPYIDKKLTWGAKLSAYKELFDSSKILVGIELQEDIPCPNNYISIDHHNERANELASIEQIAELLGIQLSYYQQLVAANDKGYIPAMRALGASESDIIFIRQKDRAAQGVTEQDELWGKEAVSNLQWQKGIAIAYTQSERFSPVTDRLEVVKLIVYNDYSLTYYGVNVDKLIAHYSHLIKTGKAYNGGGDAGFFGFANGMFDKSELKKKIQEISELV
ncbi:MAG: hypothetical protein R3E32_12890 [Chitinophagales bacterium]